MVLEAAWVLAACIATRPRALWVRGLITLVPLAAWACLVGMMLMHMPVHVLFHAFWVWGLLSLLLIVEAIALVAGCHRWLRDRKRRRVPDVAASS